MFERIASVLGLVKKMAARQGRKMAQLVIETRKFMLKMFITSNVGNKSPSSSTMMNSAQLRNEQSTVMSSEPVYRARRFELSPKTRDLESSRLISTLKDVQVLVKFIDIGKYILKR